MKILREGKFVGGTKYVIVDEVNYKDKTYKIGDVFEWFDNEFYTAIIEDIFLIGDKQEIEFSTNTEGYGRIGVEMEAIWN